MGVCTVLGFFSNVAANMISGAPYLHYYLSNIPLLLLPAVYAFKLIYHLTCSAFSSHSGSERYRKQARFLAGCAVVFVTLFASWGSVDANIRKILENAQYKDTEVDKLVAIIQENTSPEESIVCYGDFQPVIIKASYRKSATRFFYPPVWNAFREDFVVKVQKEIASDIQQKAPAMVLIKKGMESGIFSVDSGLKPCLEQNYSVLSGSVPLQYNIYIRKQKWDE